MLIHRYFYSNAVMSVVAFPKQLSTITITHPKFCCSGAVCVNIYTYNRRRTPCAHLPLSHEKCSCSWRNSLLHLFMMFGYIWMLAKSVDMVRWQSPLTDRAPCSFTRRSHETTQAEEWCKMFATFLINQPTSNFIFSCLCDELCSAGANDGSHWNKAKSRSNSAWSITRTRTARSSKASSIWTSASRLMLDFG